MRLSLLDESRHVACASKQPITSRTIGTHGTLLGGTAAHKNSYDSAGDAPFSRRIGRDDSVRIHPEGVINNIPANA